MATALRPQNNFIVLPHTPKEAAYGTAVADGAILQMYPLAEPSLAEVVKERVYDEEHIKGHEFPMDDAQMTEIWRDATVPLVFPATAEICGLLFAQAFGANNTTGAGPYTHTITAQDGRTSDQLPSISFVQGTRGQTATYEKYKGCIPNEVRFAVENRGRINVASTYFTDGSEADASAFSIPASFATQTPLFGKNSTFQMGNAGGALTDFSSLLRGFEVVWNNNLSREDAHGMINDGVNLTTLRFGTRSLSVIVRIWGSKGDAFYSSDFLSDTLKDVELKVVNGSSSVTFNIDRCIIESVRDSFDDIRNVLELTLKPFTITSSGISPIQVVVVNGISAYLA